MNFEMADLFRRLENLIRIGTIAELDANKARVRVHIGDLKTDWLPWITHRAGGDRTWWAPEPDEQVIVLSPSGDPAQGVVLGSSYQDSAAANGTTADVHRTTYMDGAEIEYNRETHHLKATLPDGATTELISDGGIEFTGDMILNGNYTVNGNVKVNGSEELTGDCTASGISLVNHIHGGVLPGGAKTAVPE